MFSTYKDADVTVLLKDITGKIEPLPTSVREKRIQSGTHYCEMLPIENLPSGPYLATYEYALENYAAMTALAVAGVAERIYREKGRDGVLVSLARAGTPIGILIRRYLLSRHGVDYPHYTVSIIRGRGIDRNAMKTILSRHSPASLQFVDGWTGKGAIQNQLSEALRDFPGVSAGLAVLSDPAGVAAIRGTYDDFLIPSSCLNAVVSGLLSRTVLREDLIGPEDYHGAVFYREWLEADRTESFLSAIEAAFPDAGAEDALPAEWEAAGTLRAADGALEEVEVIRKTFGIRNINLIKPSIGEATRVLLRRMPWKILVHSLEDAEHLGHIYLLAREKGVELVPWPLKHYRACGLIREVADA